MAKPLLLSGVQLTLIEDLGPLIDAIELIRLELGLGSWSDLEKWCDDGDPRSIDGDGLELLYERLSIVYADFKPRPNGT